MEYYSTIKKNEVVTPATTWVNLEDIKCIVNYYSSQPCLYTRLTWYTAFKNDDAWLTSSTIQT